MRRAAGLDHAARLGQPLLVLVGFHDIQQVGFAGELAKIRMCGDQGLAPADQRLVRGEEIDDVAVFRVGQRSQQPSPEPRFMLS